MDQGGALVPLVQVADIGPEPTNNLIARESARRKAVISCNLAEGYNLGQLVEQVRAKVDPIVQRAGYAVHYGGQFEAQQSAAQTICVAGLGVIIVMIMLLQLSTSSLRAALLVMVNLPLAIIGGVIAIYVTESGGGPLAAFGNTLALFGLTSEPYREPVVSIASMVGFVTLFGIAVQSGILLVNHYQRVMVEEGKPLFDAIVQGSIERLVPMTHDGAVCGPWPCTARPARRSARQRAARAARDRRPGRPHHLDVPERHRGPRRVFAGVRRATRGRSGHRRLFWTA